MRIRQVVTLVSEDAAFGGPVTVATGQLAGLAAAGNDVALLSLWRGRTPAPSEIGGVPLLTRKAHRMAATRGFVGLMNPMLFADLWREANQCDLLHIHAGRDLVSVAAVMTAVAARTPFVVQTHGMIQPRAGWVPKLFDAFYLPLLCRAARILVLTEREADTIRRVVGSGGPPFEVVPNGVSPDVVTRMERTGPQTVLYLARVAASKRPRIFVEAAARVHREVPEARFVIHGPDGGALGEVLATIDSLGLAGVVRYGGPLDHSDALTALRAADVYVLPSAYEPFGMSLLESMAAGTASVCTEAFAIAAQLREHGGAVVTDGSAQGIAESVILLLRDDEMRRELAETGRETVRRHFSATAVVDQLVDLYAAVVLVRPRSAVRVRRQRPRRSQSKLRPTRASSAFTDSSK